LLQPAQLSLADAQQGTADNHPDDATAHESRTGGQKHVALLGGDVVSRAQETPAISTKSSHSHEHPTNNERNSRDAKSDAGSLHTKLHLLQRVSVGCPWRAWHNFDTSIV
jgi:hypothetical protein